MGRFAARAARQGLDALAGARADAHMGNLDRLVLPTRWASGPRVLPVRRAWPLRASVIRLRLGPR